MPTYADHVVQVGEASDQLLIDVRDLEMKYAPVELVVELEVPKVGQLGQEGADRLSLAQLDDEAVFLRLDPLDHPVRDRAQRPEGEDRQRRRGDRRPVVPRAAR